MISAPLQFNYNDGFGPQDGRQSCVNVQPVAPFSLSEHWSLIVRAIVPESGPEGWGARVVLTFLFPTG